MITPAPQRMPGPDREGHRRRDGLWSHRTPGRLGDTDHAAMVAREVVRRVERVLPRLRRVRVHRLGVGSVMC
jgi:hypothetical protein